MRQLRGGCKFLGVAAVRDFGVLEVFLHGEDGW